jgi:hypothetical protein
MGKSALFRITFMTWYKSEKSKKNRIYAMG